jgi:hypothetical protein
MASSPARDPGVGDVLSLDAGDDGNGFALLTESTTSTGNDTFSSFSLQGAPLVQIETSPGLLGAVASPRGYVSGVVGTPRGLAVIAADGSSSFTTTLLDSSGASVAQAKLVSGGFPRLAWTGSSLVAWWAPSTYTQESCPGTGVVTDLGLFGEPGWTASLALCNASAPFEAGGRVLVAGVTASGGLALLARTGSDFTQVSPVTTLQIAADGCGRPVELENTSGDPVSPWDTGGPLLAQAVPGTKPLPVSTSSPQVYVTGPSVAPVPVGLGVLWAEQEVGPGGPANLRFATLAWR